MTAGGSILPCYMGIVGIHHEKQAQQGMGLDQKAGGKIKEFVTFFRKDAGILHVPSAFLIFQLDGNKIPLSIPLDSEAQLAYISALIW